MKAPMTQVRVVTPGEVLNFVCDFWGINNGILVIKKNGEPIALINVWHSAMVIQ